MLKIVRNAQKVKERSQLCRTVELLDCDFDCLYIVDDKTCIPKTTGEQYKPVFSQVLDSELKAITVNTSLEKVEIIIQWS